MSVSALVVTVRKVLVQLPSAYLVTYPIPSNLHTLALLEALFLRRAIRDLHLSKAGPETLSPQFFPRSQSCSSRALTLQKTGVTGSSSSLRPKGSGPFWQMNGQASPEEQSSKRNQMENIMTAIGYVTKQADGRYKGTLRTVSIKADIDILPNTQKTSDSQPDFRVVTEGIEIGAGWSKTGETSGKEYVSLSIATPEFGPRKLYANLGRAAGSDDENFFAVIWNPGD
jgi:uncharacterized protein (DUF736 family)